MSDLIYVYGFINTKQNPPKFKGIDGERDVYPIPMGSINAVVCDVCEQEFGQEVLQQKVEQADWLHEKAFHHHESLMKLYEYCTVIPMKFGTIYKSLDSLESTIATHHDRLIESLETLTDKEEWNFKIYCNNEKLREGIADHNPTVDQKKEEIAGLSPGRQYLEKRKLSQLVDQELEKEKESFYTLVHDSLEAFSVSSEVKKNWSKSVTGRNEEMAWNSVYLIQQNKVESFLDHIKELRRKWEESGWMLEATGPWPAYHFVTLPKSEGAR
ncbi:GvpL/GvpF family gas vesicle protein [Virgibacillus sp. L01]|uniref:GvpL/GvpF family gas vesicle protein n=1 Tax=Virgibacillus sp. L01 TaxID=3457429 RepID=UPI003FD1194D